MQTPEDQEDSSITEQTDPVAEEYPDDLREFIKKLRTLKPLNWPPSP